MNIELDDQLVKHAQDYAVIENRPVAKQIEHWAQIGRIVEDILTCHTSSLGMHYLRLLKLMLVKARPMSGVKNKEPEIIMLCFLRQVIDIGAHAVSPEFHTYTV
jgi:hypothetical protein